MLVVTHVLYASHGGPAGITDFPARSQTTRIFEKCTVQNIAAIEKTGQREDGNDQKGGSDQDKESNDGFLAAVEEEFMDVRTCLIRVQPGARFDLRIAPKVLGV